MTTPRLPAGMKRSSTGSPSQLSPAMIERIKVNAPRIRMSEMARLLGVKHETLTGWAYKLGVKFKRTGYAQAPKKPVQSQQIDRMMELAGHTGTTGAQKERVR